MINTNKITLGSDPEFWLVSKLTNQPIPTIGIVSGEKEKPILIGCGNGFSYLRDNCSLEFNIPPARTCKEFLDNHQIAIANLEKLFPDYNFLFEGSIEFHPDLLKSKEAITIGCAEDFNVYTQDVDVLPNLSNTNKRYAGGHIHIGYDEPNWIKSSYIVKYLDLYLLSIAYLIDPDEERKTIYGLPGRCRMKDYGVEYRPLSNFWLNEDLAIMVYDQTIKAIKAFNQNTDNIDFVTDRILDLFNTNNKFGIIELIKEFDVIPLEQINKLKKITYAGRSNVEYIIQ